MGFGETFLVRPGRLPPPSGEGWGGRALRVALPGAAYQVSGLDGAQVAAVERRFAGATPGDSAARPLPIEVRRADPALFRSIDTRGWEYALDFDFAPDGLRLVGLGLAAEVEWRDGGAATLWTTRGEPEHALGHLENLLRVLTAYRLLAGGGVMVHCAAVAWRGRALLAVGRSGAGKTTFSRLAAAGGGLVLSDDLAAVRSTPAGLWIDPLPFGGDFGPPTPGSPPLPLGALLRLEQAPCDELRPLGRAEAVALLLACSPVVNQDPYHRDELLAVLSGLLTSGRAPALRVLAFTRQGGCWALVRAELLTAGAAAP